jgi:hypothetical protein
MAVGVISRVAEHIAPSFQMIGGALTKVAGRAARYIVTKLHWFPFLARRAPAQAVGAVSPSESTLAAHDANAAGAVFSSSQFKGDSPLHDDRPSMAMKPESAYLVALHTQIPEFCWN